MTIKVKFTLISLTLIIVAAVSVYSLSFKPSPKVLAFTSVNSISELNHALNIAAQQQRPVILDVYAEWCSPCIALTQQTFPDANVFPHLNKFTRLKANVTANSSADIALMQHLKVIGFPSLLFWDSQGNSLPQIKISGFINADNFSHHLQQSILFPSSSSISQNNTQ